VEGGGFSRENMDVSVEWEADEEDARLGGIGTGRETGTGYWDP
jgi:hypothetical protein